MTERRLENRFACADLVHMEWTEDNDHGFQATEAVLEDISRIGACVEVEERIPLGAKIIITLGRQQLCGEVCYCVFRDYGYFVGIRFSDNTPWSSRAAEPAHLTDFRQIAAMASDS